MLMRKYLFVVILFVVLSGTSYSQTNYDYLLSPLMDSYSYNYQSVENAGKGYTGIGSSGNILSSVLNPASVEIEKGYQLYTEYNLKGRPDNMAGLKQFHPTFALGLGYRVTKDLQLGFVYRDDRSLHSEDQNSDIYSINHIISVPVNYRYKSFKFGVNLNLIILHGSYSYIYGIFPNYNSSVSQLRFNPEFGIKADINKDISVGVTFIPEYEQELEWTINDGSSGTRTNNTKALYPMKIGAGAEFRLLDGKLNLLCDYRFERTSAYKYSEMSDENLFKDRHNLHLGAEFQPDKNLTLRTGFLSLLALKSPRRSLYLLFDDEYYFTFGASYKYKGMSYNFAYLNSAIVRITDYSHILFNFGISYDF
jgi:hypothetical protein